jgi:hypothetical protein
MMRYFLATIIMASIVCGRSHATPIQYSWAGTIVPESVSDPWSIGQQGQPFSLSGVVTDSAGDLLDDSQQFAAFDLTHATLVVSGQTVPYVGSGTIDFTDNSGGLTDLVVMSGEFEWFDTRIDIGSGVALGLSTFSFSQMNESLPVFPTTTNLDRATCCGGPYTLIVETGSVVSVVPEPTTAMLYLIAAILLVNNRKAVIWRLG